MAQVRISILDPTGGKKTLVEVPDNVESEKLVRALASRMGLPTADIAGNVVAYRLGATRNGEYLELSADETLAQAGVQNDDVLRLYSQANTNFGLGKSAFEGHGNAKYFHSDAVMQELSRINSLLEQLAPMLDKAKRQDVEKIQQEVREQIEVMSIPVRIAESEYEPIPMVRADRIHYIEEYRSEERMWGAIAGSLAGLAGGVVVNWVTSEPLVFTSVSIILISAFLALGSFAFWTARHFHRLAEQRKQSLLYSKMNKGAENP